MSINLDEEIQKASKDMEEAEDSLVEKGFPVEQWMLIKQYVASAIIHSQWVIAKANSEISKEATFQSTVL